MLTASINKYPNFLYGAGGINFGHYYAASHESDYLSDPLTKYITENLVSSVDCIVNFGCASGKDFIPFQDSYKCIGFDIAPVENINWVCKTDNLTYYECSIEDFLANIDRFDINWEKTLAYAQGTLMYVSHENQNKLVEVLIAKGCKNITISEYEPGNSGPNPFLHLTEDNLKLFERKYLRGSYHHNPTSHIMLEPKL